MPPSTDLDEQVHSALQVEEPALAEAASAAPRRARRRPRKRLRRRRLQKPDGRSLLLYDPRS